jgi:hypothetical protein
MRALTAAEAADIAYQAGHYRKLAQNHRAERAAAKG